MSGTTAIVDAPDHAVGDGGEPQGAVYIFVQDGTTWSQQAELIASDSAPGDHFGYSVAVSGDTVVVGAPGHTVGANAGQGVAYIFARDSATWSQQAEASRPAMARGRAS